MRIYLTIFFSSHPGELCKIITSGERRIDGEWCLLWQSKMSDRQDAAFRMFTVIGIILLFVVQPGTEAQP
jgi:predicted small integral membrane protein